MLLGNSSIKGHRRSEDIKYIRSKVQGGRSPTIDNDSIQKSSLISDKTPRFQSIHQMVSSICANQVANNLEEGSFEKGSESNLQRNISMKNIDTIGDIELGQQVFLQKDPNYNSSIAFDTYDTRVEK